MRRDCDRIVKNVLSEELWDIGDSSHVACVTECHQIFFQGSWRVCKGQAVDSSGCQERLTVQHSVYPKKTQILSIAALRILHLICGQSVTQ